MQNDYKITANKFFSTEERRQMLKHTENMALADQAKGRRTWQVRWMLVHLAMYSGLRVSEIAALKISDLKLSNGNPYIYVRKGKGGKDRDVYIDKNLCQHLQDFIQTKESFGESTAPDAPLFAGQSGKHITTTALTLSFGKAVEAAGVRDDLTLHSARHTYATILFASTRNLKYVQKQLGHSHMHMTGLYADVLPEENGKLANQILDDKPEPESKPKQTGTIKRGVSLAQLKSAAEELNDELGLEPQIDITADRETLRAKLQEALPLIDFENDELTESTLQVIREITANDKTA